MRRWISFPLFWLSLLLILGMALANGCDEGGANPVRPVNGVIEMTASAFAFKPDQIAMEVGEQVTLKLTSTDSLHTFTIRDLGIDVEIPPGETAAVDLTGTRKGTYTFYCTVPGHREKGMEGSLFVSQRPLAPTRSAGGGGYSY